MSYHKIHPAISVIMPVYGAELTVAEAVLSVLEQSFQDFELVIVNDGTKDCSIEICEGFEDNRIRIVSQANRGLAGARNTGIRNARGQYIAFLDADDTWHTDKLRNHYMHLQASPNVGVSYAGSTMTDEAGRPLKLRQSPRLEHVTPQHIFLRNPIGNGSAPVIRREVLDDIAFFDSSHGERAFFDESFRQSEDIECWVRIALETDWKFEGIPGHLTNYRINSGGLSADVTKQLSNWERMTDKVAHADPALYRGSGRLARAFQLRYLARRAVQGGAASSGFKLCCDAIAEAPQMLLREPRKTFLTFAAALTFVIAPKPLAVRLRRRLFDGRD